MKLVALVVSALVGTLLALVPTSAHAADTPYAVTPFRVQAGDDARLVHAWRAWRARDDSRYSTIVRRACECLPEEPVRTDVRGRTVTSVRFQGTPDEIGRDGYEMEALYRLLRRGYADADAVRVRYRQGVPVSIYIDWDAGLADEETILSVKTVGAKAAASSRGYAIAGFRLRAHDRPELKRAWRTWRATGIDRYDTTAYRAAGEGQWPKVRTVVDGRRVLAVRVVDDSGLEPPRRGHEMEQLFRFVRSLFRSADEATVRFGPRGVPALISADPVKDAVDDEFFMRVVLRAHHRAGGDRAPAEAARASTGRGDGAPYRITRFSTRATDDPALVEGWETWASREVGRYATVVTSSCFCPPQKPLRTTVRGARVTSVAFQGETRQQRRAGYEMEALYRLLRRGYAEADRVDVTYRRGVPTQVAIDWDEMLADEETYLSVRLVQPR